MIKFTKPFPELKTSHIKPKKLKKLIKPIVYAFAIIGMLTVIVFFSLLRLLNGGQTDTPISVPDNAVITLNLNQKFNEGHTDSLWAEFNGSDMSYFDIIKYLNLATLDDNVKGLLVKINTTELGLSQIQTLRQTIKNFRDSGKKTYIFSSGMGDLGRGTDEYYLASAFEKIYMQPNSDLGLTGINIEIPFINAGLRKFGIDAEFYTRYEYKNAADSLTHEHISPTYKKQLTYIGRGIYDTICNDIAQSRNLSLKQVNTLINKAPLSAEEALAAGLIDETAYYSEVKKQILAETNGSFISLSNYGADFVPVKSKDSAIAYLTVEGTIVEGDNSGVALSEEITVSSDEIIKNINAIEKNKNIKALVLRVNSPGGSYTAADAVWRELMLLKQKRNIPIIVSMGDYAASGGYFISLAADKIFAEPLTLTGSIGVLGGKMVMADLWKKLDITWNGIKFGNNAGIVSANRKFSATEKQAFNRSLDNIYKDFTAKVSSARKIEITALDNLARGRVWLGIDAVKNGLIDEIGDINTAVNAAKELGGIKPEQNFNILFYPRSKSFAEKLNGLLRTMPQTAINRLATEIGLDIQELNVLKQMQYNCVMTPFLIYK